MAPSREIAQLLRKCVLARNVIAQAFVDSVVNPSEEGQLAAWGQYLDLRQRGISRQYGIYGTTAGIQVLAMHDAQVHAELVSTAEAILPLTGSDTSDTEARKIRDYFTQKDLQVTYKVTALVDAIRPDLESLQGRHPAIERLLEMRHRGGGWPDFRSASLDGFHGPKVHATAVALLSLSRFPDVRASDDCREAVEWLARHVEPDFCSIATLAICYLAFIRCASGDNASKEVHSALARCGRAVLGWAAKSAPEDVRRALEATEYLLPKHDDGAPAKLPLGNKDHDFRFLLYSPHCLAALALMEMRPRSAGPRVRRYVIGVVSEVASRTCDTGSFIAAGRSAVSSVEHLWIYRTLREFQDWCEQVGPVQVLRDWVWRLAAPRRWVTITACVLAAWVILSQSASLVAGIVLTAITTVSLTVLSTVVYDEIFGRW